MSDTPHIFILAKGGEKWVGGHHYWLNLAKALIAIKEAGTDLDLSVLVDRRSQLTAFEPLKEKLSILNELEAAQRPFTLFNRVRWRLTRVGGQSINPRVEEALDKLGATFVFPLRSKRINSAEWIPDFQFHHFPCGANPMEVEERKRDASAAVNTAQRIVLSSFSAEKDCLDLFPNSKGRTHVLRFRVSIDPEALKPDPQEIVRRYNLPKRYVLLSNLLAPTKNHRVVLKALARIPKVERNGVHVVCTGDIFDYRNPGFYNQFFSEIHELGVRDSVSVLGLIPKTHQIQLLRAALASLQPSLFEGWHTGVEEAHMLGKPILLSDIPVHREQSPPRATFFNANSPDSLAECLRAVFSTSQIDGFSGAAELSAVATYEQLRLKYAKSFLDLALNRA